MQRYSLSQRKPLLRLTERDEAIIECLRQFKYATTDHIQSLFFGCQRRAQARLKLLHDSRYIKRIDQGRGFPYVYTINGARTKHLEHHLAIMDAYSILKPRLIEFQPLPHRKFMYQGRKMEFTPDAFLILKGKVKTLIYLEVELQCVPQNWKKVRQFESYYLSGAYKQESWGKLGNVYPRIVILSDEKKLPGYQAAVKRLSTIELQWQFITNPSEL